MLPQQHVLLEADALAQKRACVRSWLPPLISRIPATDMLFLFLTIRSQRFHNYEVMCICLNGSERHHFIKEILIRWPGRVIDTVSRRTTVIP